MVVRDPSGDAVSAVVEAKVRALRAKEREIAAHRRAILLHQYAAGLHETNRRPDLAAIARSREATVRERLADALREQTAAVDK
jgi:hypothetical protein